MPEYISLSRRDGLFVFMQDHEEAYKWYHRAALQGCATGCRTQPETALRPVDTTKSTLSLPASTLFLAMCCGVLAPCRYTRAQNSVGQLLLRGQGCAADMTAAVIWFRKAAAQAPTRCATAARLVVA